VKSEASEALQSVSILACGRVEKGGHNARLEGNWRHGFGGQYMTLVIITITIYASI
jgi:hypothetical protein